MSLSFDSFVVSLCVADFIFVIVAVSICFLVADSSGFRFGLDSLGLRMRERVFSSLNQEILEDIPAAAFKRLECGTAR